MSRIELGKKYLISVKPFDECVWGSHQFPTLTRFGGKIYLRWAEAPDSVRSFGLPGGRAVYNEEIDTWEPFSSEDHSVQMDSGAVSGTVEFPDGSLLTSVSPRGIDVQYLNLPEKRWENFPWGIQAAYDARDLAPIQTKWWHFKRCKGTGHPWTTEMPEVNIPGELRLQREGLLMFPCFRHMHRLSDGTLLGVKMTLRLIDEKPCHYTRILVVASEDDGATWNLRGEVPYQPATHLDPHWENVMGFNEPFIQETKDGSVVMFIRTQEHHKAPMYLTRSTDKGATWSRPEPFGDHGVKPRMTRVGDSILLCYGRPGVSVRVCDDPKGLEWGEEVVVLPWDGELWNGSCGYVSPLTLDDETALIAYSDFEHRNEDGVRCKAIYVQKVHIRK